MAGQMQQSMNEQRPENVSHGGPVLKRKTVGHMGVQNNIAEKEFYTCRNEVSLLLHGKGEYVGCPVLTAIIPVESACVPVIGYENAELGIAQMKKIKKMSGVLLQSFQIYPY